MTEAYDWLPTSDTSAAVAALAYAQAGMRPVLLYGVAAGGGACACGRATCTERGWGKHPRLNAWQRIATADVAIVADQWRKYGDGANVGLAMGGEARLVAVDVDGQVGAATLARLEAEHGALPETLTARSGRAEGGEHRIFRLSDDANLYAIKGRKVGDGIDVKGDGGQIVVAPSMHASGRRYEWVSRIAPAEMPEWLFRWLTRRIEKPRPASMATSAAVGRDGPRPAADVERRASMYLGKLDSAVSGQNGSDACYKAALVLVRGFGMSEEAAMAMLTREYNPRCRPPWSEAELRHKVRDAAQAAVPDGYLRDVERARAGSAEADGRSRGEREIAGAVAPMSAGAALVVDSDDWRGLLLMKDGEIENNLENARIVLSHHAAWRGVLAWNEFAERIAVVRKPPLAGRPEAGGEQYEWADIDFARTRAWFQREMQMSVADTDVRPAVQMVAENERFHPVRAYLEGLRWDGQMRLGRLLTDYAHCADTDYAREVGRRWMISAVARVMQPGCQVDCMLVLEGPQALGKSKFFRNLVPDVRMYSDTGVNIGDKDSYQALHGIWLFVFDELSAIRSVSIEKSKNFLTSQKDHIRVPYGRTFGAYPRQNVFGGTTNEERYLIDKSGNRRYWPIRVLAPVDIASLVRDRDQMWAEAYSAYQRGETWHADTPELVAMFAVEQTRRVEDSEDVWEIIISEYIRTHPSVLSSGITMSDTLLHVLDVRSGNMRGTEGKRVKQCFLSLGWKRVQVGRDRQWRYVPSAFDGTGGLSAPSDGST